MAATGGFPGQDQSAELAAYTGWTHQGDQPGDAPWGWTAKGDGPEYAMCVLAQHKRQSYINAFSDPDGWSDQTERLLIRDAYAHATVWPSGDRQITAAVTVLAAERGHSMAAANILDVDTEKAGVPFGTAQIIAVSPTRAILKW